MQTVLYNQGSKNAENVEIKYDFPSGIKVNGLNFGRSYIADQKYSLEYTTQNGATRNIDLPENKNHFYTKEELQLQTGEYMKSATLKIENFTTINTISYNPS